MENEIRISNLNDATITREEFYEFNKKNKLFVTKISQILKCILNHHGWKEIDICDIYPYEINCVSTYDFDDTLAVYFLRPRNIWDSRDLIKKDYKFPVDFLFMNNEELEKAVEELTESWKQKEREKKENARIREQQRKDRNERDLYEILRDKYEYKKDVGKINIFDYT